MKPNPRSQVSSNLLQSPPKSKEQGVFPKNLKDQNARESLSPTRELALVSPTKPANQNSHIDSQSQKNLHDELTRFDFSFKKKPNLAPTGLPCSLVQDLSAKLGLEEDSLGRDSLRPIWPARDPLKDDEMSQTSFRVSQSVLVLRLLLRGKLRAEISLMGALNKIWGDRIKKKDLVRVLKATDFNVIVDPDASGPVESRLEQRRLKTLKVKFVNVGAKRVDNAR